MHNHQCDNIEINDLCEIIHWLIIAERQTSSMLTILMEQNVHSKKFDTFFITGYLFFLKKHEKLRYWFLCYRSFAGKLHGFFHALWVHLVFWLSFVPHSRLAICDCLQMIYRRFVLTPTNQKKSLLLEWHWYQCYAMSHQISAS